MNRILLFILFSTLTNFIQDAGYVSATQARDMAKKIVEANKTR